MNELDLSRDPDALHDDDTVCYLLIQVRRNGAMSVAGHINNEAYALAMLEQAKETVRSHAMRRRGALIVPPSMTDFAG
jgi:hypothetical protein